MTLDELRALVAATTHTDWHELGSGGTFLADFSEGSEGGEWRLFHDVHYGRAALRSNLDVGLAWGLTWHREFTEPWTRRFPDQTPGIGHYADLFWRGTPIVRESYVVVDGGRYALPLPRQNFEELTTDKHVLLPYTISSWQHAFIGIVSGLSASHPFEQGLERAQIQVED